MSCFTQCDERIKKGVRDPRNILAFYPHGLQALKNLKRCNSEPNVPFSENEDNLHGSDDEDDFILDLDQTGEADFGVRSISQWSSGLRNVYVFKLSPNK